MKQFSVLVQNEPGAGVDDISGIDPGHQRPSGAPGNIPAVDRYRFGQKGGTSGMIQVAMGKDNSVDPVATISLQERKHGSGKGPVLS